MNDTEPNHTAPLAGYVVINTTTYELLTKNGTTNDHTNAEVLSTEADAETFRENATLDAPLAIAELHLTE